MHKSLTTYFFMAICFISVQAQTVKINSVKAYLYYNEDNSIKKEKVAGSFSEDVLDKPELALYNTIIGEGSAKGCSEQVFVVVEIIKKGKQSTNTNLKFAAYSGKKKILERNEKIYLCSEVHYSSFLLYDVGCDPVKIIAEIKDKEKGDKVEKTIPFECGE